MKRVLFLIALVVFGLGTALQAQTVNQDIQNLNKDKEAIKAAKAAEKAVKKQMEQAENEAWFNAAVQALKDGKFVVEANRIEFKRGRFVYVTPSTNFVSLDGKHATVQLAFNTGYAGPNGIGGITVDGQVSGIEMKTDKKGNINYRMMVQGSAISATVNIRLQQGSNQATATVDPNFSSNRISFTGTLYPAEESNVFKGRSIF